MMAEKIPGRFDLLGDPVPENWLKRGRPPHIPIQENRNKVRLLLAFDWSDQRIARALRITAETLRKHYFVELRQRDEARAALEANAKMMVYRAAVGGNVGAMKMLVGMIDKHDLTRPRPPQKTKPETLGKKALADLAAQDIDPGNAWAPLLN